MYSFIYSLKYYSVSDIKCLIFLKVFRNECEEEFRFALKSINNVLKELLKVSLKYSLEPF